jgi:hypothetical protein
MPKLRYQPPERLTGAALFSQHPELCGSLNAVRLVKSQRWAWDGLREACELEARHGRKRARGHWELAAVAFVTSGQVDVKPWWHETTDELWRECGFQRRPSRQTADRRLREIATVCDEFLHAAALVIRRCRAHDPRVMAHTHYDWTEDETHAALVHDCQPGESCKRRVVTTKSGRQRSAPGHANRMARAATSEARWQREQWNEQDPAESEWHASEAAPEQTATVRRGPRSMKRVRVNGCWYRTRDEDAGVRAYVTNGRTRRFWNGYFSGKAICHYTGGVIPSVDAANRQECHLFNELFDRVRGMVGATPETAIGDRGLSVESCFRHVTTHGTAPVFPWRGGKKRQRHDEETHDRHGVKRCKHCGGPMSQVKFSAANGKPRLWFKCTRLGTAECARPQTITCATDWRLLVPLARTEPLYFELKESHSSYEAVHDYWRDRYRVAADTLANRPKAVGLDWHRLRANVACLVDWLRIAAVNGWLGSTRAARRHKGERRFQKSSERNAEKFADKRARIGLGDHYGPQAKKLGLGDETPPSRRPRGAPPGS